MKTIPFWHKSRWKFEISTRRLHIRAGLVLFEVCLNSLQPTVNTIWGNDRISGAWMAWMALSIKSGQTLKIHGWRKVEPLKQMEYTCQR